MEYGNHLNVTCYKCYMLHFSWLGLTDLLVLKKFAPRFAWVEMNRYPPHPQPVIALGFSDELLQFLGRSSLKVEVVCSLCSQPCPLSNMTVVILRHTDEDDCMKCTVTDNLGLMGKAHSSTTRAVFTVWFSTNPSAAMWTMWTKWVTKRDTLGGTQKLTFINESGLYGLTLSLNPSATMWTQRTNGVTIRYPIGRRQKVIFINKGRPDSGLPWWTTANRTADEQFCATLKNKSKKVKG